MYEDRPEAWWELEKSEAPEAIANAVGALDNEQSYRTESNLRNLRLYSNLVTMGFGASEYADDNHLPHNRLTLNVVESVIEAAKALISTNRPRVKFLTEGGGYSDRKRAENLSNLVHGMFYATNLYEKAQEAFADACIYGTGFVRVYEKNGRVETERCLTEEVIVDDVEAKYGYPRSLYIHKEVEKSVLAKRYPKHADKIMEAGQMRQVSHLSRGLSRPVSVVTAYHLPSAPGAGDGRMVVCTDNANLVDKKYKDDTFPLAALRWAKRSLGYWGKGVPEQLRGIQIEINMLLQKVQRLMNLASSKVFVQRGSKVNKAKLDNTEWGIVEYTGDRPPVFAMVAAVAPEYYAQLESLYQKAFEVAGISQMAAQSKKPAGLESGKAIREYNDIQTQRFLHIGQQWEKFFIDIAEQMILCAKRIPGFKVLAQDDEKLFEVKWSDVDPGERGYRMKAWPSSLLPDTPAGKLQTIQELLQVDPRMQPYALQLLRVPELESALRRVNAPVLVVDKIIGKILEEGVYIPPEPYMDLEISIMQMQNAYLEAIICEVEEEKLEMMRNWIDAASVLIAPPPMMGMQPMAAPASMPAEGGMPAEQPFSPVGAQIPL